MSFFSASFALNVKFILVRRMEMIAESKESKGKMEVKSKTWLIDPAQQEDFQNQPVKILDGQ